MNGFRIRLMWVGLSAVGLALGAILAIGAVPEARFGINPTGRFHSYLVEFSLLVAVPFAVAQWIGLLLILPRRIARQVTVSVLWIPVTCVGVLAMLLPMWWWSASSLTGMPIGVAIALLPGAAILGVSQAHVLRLLTGRCDYWLISTLLGVAFGSVFGLMFAMNAGNALEVIWAAITGLGIAGFQSAALIHNTAQS